MLSVLLAEQIGFRRLDFYSVALEVAEGLYCAVQYWLLASDAIAGVDFGRGDDGYKRLWVGQRDQRVGVLLANPRRVKGLVTILRHVAGSLRRRISSLRPAV